MSFFAVFKLHISSFLMIIFPFCLKQDVNRLFNPPCLVYRYRSKFMFTSQVKHQVSSSFTPIKSFPLSILLSTHPFIMTNHYSLFSRQFTYLLRIFQDSVDLIFFKCFSIYCLCPHFTMSCRLILQTHKNFQ